MPRLATPCISISIVPTHIQYQLPNLPRIQIPKPTLNGPRLVRSNLLLVCTAKSYSPIVHPLSSKRPAEDHGINRDEAATIISTKSAAKNVHEEGHLQSARPPKLAEHDAVLCWVGLCGDGVAGEGVGLCHLAGPGAEHGADWCCGGHCGGVVG